MLELLETKEIPCGELRFKCSCDCARFEHKHRLTIAAHRKTSTARG
jgi:hypothetical protein